MKPIKLYMGIPAQNATIHVGILDFLNRMRGGLFKYEGRMFEIECGFVPYITPVECARNALVKMFLETDCEYLWFVDADVYPDSTGLMMLDALDKADIITGRVTVWMPIPDQGGWYVQPTAATKIEGNKKYCLHDLGSGPIRYDIGGAGTGCLLIARKVLEDRRMWQPTKYVDNDGTEKELGADEPPPIFTTLYKPNGKRVLGEDYAFTSKAKELGYTVAYVPYAHWHHAKAVSLLDVEKFAQRSYENGFRFGREHAAGETPA